MNGQSDWQLALEQRQDLSIASGTVSALAAAVRRGADLRLYMTHESYEETLYFQQTYAGAEDRFAGIMSHHHSYVDRGQEIEQPYISIFKYDTSGRFDQVKWKFGDVAVDESQAYPYGVYRWFVCDRWRCVYENDAEGNRVSGDLDELMECVRRGRSLRLGIRQLFGLAEEQLEGPAHISFLTTMQPVIKDGCVESNCDLVAVGAPRWPFSWSDGLHLATMLPATSGELLCFLAVPGRLPFARALRRRAMQWMVADIA
jgi:hypothetical protein